METLQSSLDHLIRENPMGEARKDALRLDFLLFLAGMLAELTVRGVELEPHIFLTIEAVARRSTVYELIGNVD